MRFSNYYVYQESNIKTNRDIRFLGASENKETWGTKIKDIVESLHAAEIEKDMTFFISDPTENFVLTLNYKHSNDSFSYAVKEKSVEWMHKHGLTDENSNLNFYYSVPSRAFVIKKHGIEEEIENNFKLSQLNTFLHDLYYVNRSCISRKRFVLVGSLHYLDVFTKEEAERLKNSGMTPRWFIYSMKDDDFRKESGLFSFFRN